MTQKEIIQGLGSIENRAIDFPYMTASDWVAIGAAKRHLENSLEVKEADLEKAIDGLTAGWIEGEEYGELQNINACKCVTLGEVKEAMRCMFELGLKVQKGE